MCLSFCSQGVWLPSMHRRSHDQHPVGLASQHALQVTWSASSGVSFPACITGLHPGSLPTEGVCLQGVCLQRGLCIWGRGSRGFANMGFRRPPRTRKAGSMHPTGMLSSCKLLWTFKNYDIQFLIRHTALRSFESNLSRRIVHVKHFVVKSDKRATIM